MCHIYSVVWASLMKKASFDCQHERRDTEAVSQIDVCSQVMPIPPTGLMLEGNTRGGRGRWEASREREERQREGEAEREIIVFPKKRF